MSPAPSQILDDARGRPAPYHDLADLLGNRAALLAATTLVFIGLTITFFLNRQPVTIIVDGQEVVVQTNARTVISALHDARISVSLADSVVPDRYTAVQSGLVVHVDRAVPVTVAVDGRNVDLRTQADTVAEALVDAGVELAPEDLVLSQGVPVAPNTLLAEAATSSLVASTEGAAERPHLASRQGRSGGPSTTPLPAHLDIRRAVPLSVHDAGLETKIFSAAETVGEALRGAGINLYLADAVQPGVETPLQAEMHVYIDRSKAITIVTDDPEIAPAGSFVTRTRRDTLREVIADEGIVLSGREDIQPPLDAPTRHGLEVAIRRFHPVSVAVDGRVVDTKTKKGTIGELLSDEGISLGPLDKISPPLDAIPNDHTLVNITRVREVVQEEPEEIPFETGLFQPSDEVELDTREYQEGEPGVLMKRVQIVYENGEPVSRTVLDEWVEKEPIPEVTYYGTKVVIRDLETPEGTVQYWRKIDVLATYYHDSTSSKLPGDPTWGITRTGTRTHHGTIATDPNVIPLWTDMYVPGYGLGTALDTGGGVKGRHIDVWMPEGESWWGVRYPTIYLLTPVPDWYPTRLP